MEPEQPQQKTVLCEKCQKQINYSNFVIHEAMCRGNRESFILGGLNKLKSKQSKEQLEPRWIFEEKEEEPKIADTHHQHKPHSPQPLFPNPLIEKQEAPTQKPTQPKQEPKLPKKQKPPVSEQKFRCTDCGYMMTMEELDTHPKVCMAKHNKCPYCGLEFPHYLMSMHSEVCEKKTHPQTAQTQQTGQTERRTSQERQRIRQELDRRHQHDQQQRSRARPPRGTRQGNIPRDIVPVSTQTYVTREGNNRITIKRVMDENGRVYEQRFIQPIVPEPVQEEDDGMMFIVPISMGGQRGSLPENDLRAMFQGNNPFEYFIRGLMTQMGVNRKQNPGLSEQEIGRIPTVNYDSKNPKLKSTNCTICVTDYQEGDNLMLLPCGHLFNPECLVPWLKNSSLCPNCRGKVKPS